jgi:hypothetical protein
MRTCNIWNQAKPLRILSNVRNGSPYDMMVNVNLVYAKDKNNDHKKTRDRQLKMRYGKK